jgi:hypothetical protein
MGRLQERRNNQYRGFSMGGWYHKQATSLTVTGWYIQPTQESEVCMSKMVVREHFFLKINAKSSLQLRFAS